MAKDLAYDINGDLVLPPTFIYDQEELEQALLNIVLTPQGRSVDEHVGVSFDWLIGGFDEARAIAQITEALNQDERVTDVSNVSVDVSKGNESQVVINFECQTTLGQINTSKEVNIDALNR